MSARYIIRLAIVLLALLVTTVSAQRVFVHPRDTGVALVNPGMGWILYYYDDDLREFGSSLERSDSLDDFPGISVVYMRLAWSLVEPEEGKFNWAILDTPAQRWIARGKKIALRFTSAESSWPSPGFATPRCVLSAGAKGHFFELNKGVVEKGQFWEPDYDDPIYLKKLDGFLAALADRYDGDPNVAFIDVGSFGVWGEGHTLSSTCLPYSGDTIRRIIDLYCKHFKHTLLVANDDFAMQGRGMTAIEYAREHGLTLRDDSILVAPGKQAYLSADIASMFWPDVPVILETQYFGIARDRGNWRNGEGLRDAVEAYHASYASIHWWPREFFSANRDLIAEISRRLGYRLQLLDASWPGHVSSGETLEFEYRWRNAGVAPCYPGGYTAFTLKDAQGGIAAVFVDDKNNLRLLPVGSSPDAEPPSRAATFSTQLSPVSRQMVEPGTYDVYVSVGTHSGTPVIALSLAGDDGHRRYRLGAIIIAGQ